MDFCLLCDVRVNTLLPLLTVLFSAWHEKVVIEHRPLEDNSGN